MLFGQKVSSQVNGRIQKAARIIPQVYNEAPGVRSENFSNGFVKLSVNRLIELINLQICISFAVPLDDFPFYSWYCNRSSGDGDVLCCAFSVSNRENNLGSSPAANQAHRFIDVHVRRRLAVDFKNLIARAKSCLERRRIFDRRDDSKDIRLHADLDADAAEGARNLLLEFLGGFRLKKYGIWITDAIHHPFNCPIDHFLDIQLRLIHVFFLKVSPYHPEQREIYVFDLADILIYESLKCRRFVLSIGIEKTSAESERQSDNYNRRQKLSIVH